VNIKDKSKDKTLKDVRIMDTQILRLRGGGCVQHQNWPIGEKKNAYLKIKYIFLNFMLVIFLQFVFFGWGSGGGRTMFIGPKYRTL
jgi:hypothetical protein